jgi:DNA-binding MarR family transcriptional regulator
MSTEDREPNLEGLAEIDRVVHEPARLLVLCNLYVLESADFLFLLRRTGMTRGNLSAHMRKLEKAGYVDVEKTFVERLPLTVYQITQAGRTALQNYREQMTCGLSVVS